ncbi:MAG: hypothetical protein WBK55_09665 [Alphaproteobacteria bacterium]
MASAPEGQPHYPYPNLDSEEARARLENYIAGFFTGALAQQNLLKAHRQALAAQREAFKGAEKLEGKEKLQHILETLKFGPVVTPFRKQIIAPAGIGKTTRVIENLARCRGMTVWFMAPTLILAQEVCQSIKEQHPDIEVIFYQGRNEDTCDRHKIARHIGAKGINVQDNLCKKSEDECEFFSSCLYQKQREGIHELDALEATDPPRIIVMTHGYLIANSGAPKPDLVIIDETNWQNFVVVTSGKPIQGPLDLTLAEIRKFADKELGHYLSYIRTIEIIFTAMQKSPLGFLRLLAQSPAMDLSHALKHIELVVAKNSSPHIKPSHTAHKIQSSIENWEQPRLELIRLMLENLRYEIGIRKAVATSVTYNSDKETIRVHALKQNMIPREVPVLLIDASADQEINSKVWGHYLRSVEIRTERNVEIVQVPQKTFSKTSLGIAYNTDADWTPPAKALVRRQELIDFINELAESSEKPIFIAASKAIEMAISKELSSNVMLSHYGALRGKNAYEACEIAVIVGREEPNYESVEGLARALLSRSPQTLLSSQEYYPATRNRRLLGKTEPETVRAHVDAFVQKILEQIREREIEQAIDRLRLVYNALPKKVYLLTSIVIDATITETKSWEEIRHVTKMDRAIQEAFNLSKAFPLSDRDIYAFAPHLWSSPNAVGSYITRRGGIKRVASLIRYYIGTDPLLGVEYRKHKKQKRWSMAIVSGHEPETKAALEKIVGPIFAMKDPVLIQEDESDPNTDTQST